MKSTVRLKIYSLDSTVGIDIDFWHAPDLSESKIKALGVKRVKSWMKEFDYCTINDTHIIDFYTEDK